MLRATFPVFLWQNMPKGQANKIYVCVCVCVFFALPSCARGFVLILKADNKNGFTVMGANTP